MPQGLFAVVVRHETDVKKYIICRYRIEEMASSNKCTKLKVGGDKVVGVGNRYELEVSVFETRWGGDTRTCPDLPWGPHDRMFNRERVSFPRVKRQGCGFY